MEEVGEIAQQYKVGDNIQFTATLNAIFDPELKADEETPADETVIDAEVVDVEDA